MGTPLYVAAGERAWWDSLDLLGAMLGQGRIRQQQQREYIQRLHLLLSCVCEDFIGADSGIS